MSAPSSPPVADVLGGLTHTVVFEFSLRELISDRDSRAENVRFLENLNDWVWQQNHSHSFPEMYAGEKAVKIEVSDSGYLTDADESHKTGVYASLMKFTYKERKNI